MSSSTFDKDKRDESNSQPYEESIINSHPVTKIKLRRTNTENMLIIEDDQKAFEAYVKANPKMQASCFNQAMYTMMEYSPHSTRRRLSIHSELKIYSQYNNTEAFFKSGGDVPISRYGALNLTENPVVDSQQYFYQIPQPKTLIVTGNVYKALQDLVTHQPALGINVDDINSVKRPADKVSDNNNSNQAPKGGKF